MPFIYYFEMSLTTYFVLSLSQFFSEIPACEIFVRKGSEENFGMQHTSNYPIIPKPWPLYWDTLGSLCHGLYEIPPSLTLTTLDVISHNLKGIMAMQLCSPSLWSRLTLHGHSWYYFGNLLTFQALPAGWNVDFYQ